MDTVTEDTAQISLFGADELPIIEDPRAQAAPSITSEEPQARASTPPPPPTLQEIAERESRERAAAARRKKFLDKQAREAFRPAARRVRHRWENAYD